jgi:hypothetical protein
MAPREVFPLSCIRSLRVTADNKCSWARVHFAPTSISAATCSTSASGDALCRPHEFDAINEAVNGSTVA